MKIILDLVRHAESCANLPELKITDTYPKKSEIQKDFEKKIKQRNYCEYLYFNDL